MPAEPPLALPGLELAEPLGVAEEPLLPAPPASEAPEAEEPPLVPEPVPLAALDERCFFLSDFFLAFFLLGVVALSAPAPPALALSVDPADPEGAAPDVGELDGDVVEELAPPVACASTIGLLSWLLETSLPCAAEIPAAESSEINNANETFFIVASNSDMDCFKNYC
jgi:hypothetical protein